MNIFDIKIPTEYPKLKAVNKLKDLFMSPEAIKDIMNWNVDIISDQTRRELYGYGKSDGSDIQR